MQKRSLALIIILIVVIPAVSIFVAVGFYVALLFNLATSAPDNQEELSFIETSETFFYEDNYQVHIDSYFWQVQAEDNREDTTWSYALTDNRSSCKPSQEGSNQFLETEDDAFSNEDTRILGQINDYSEGDTVSLYDNSKQHVCFIINVNDSQNTVYYASSQLHTTPNPTILIMGAVSVFITIIATLAATIYVIYWFISTKKELVALGADDIPTSWLLIIPYANWYYIYKYGESSQKIAGGSMSGVVFLILTIVDFEWLGLLICQNTYNKLGDTKNLDDNSVNTDTNFTPPLNN